MASVTAGGLHRMSETDEVTALLDEVGRMFAPLVIALRRSGDTFVAELVRADGTMVWPNYAHGPSDVSRDAGWRAAVPGGGSRSRVRVRCDIHPQGAERLRRWLAGTVPDAPNSASNRTIR
jgi:hypothetical protein